MLRSQYLAMLSMLRHPLHQLRLGSESESANFKLVAQSQSVATKTNGLADAERWGDSAPCSTEGANRLIVSLSARRSARRRNALLNRLGREHPPSQSATVATALRLRPRRVGEYVGAHLVGTHAGFDQCVERGVDHRR